MLLRSSWKNLENNFLGASQRLHSVWSPTFFMKLIFILLFSTSVVWSKDLIVVSYFDSFGKAPFNNSEKVALKLSETLKDHPEINLKLCKLNTVFDKSFKQLEDCINQLHESPKLILGLGEANCNFKIETMVRNKDKSAGPDNEGNERNNTPIVTNAPSIIGLNFPLPEMYCGLSKIERKEIQVSNNAGSFVCNNLAYQFTYHYQDSVFGFIHVPANNCADLPRKTELAVKMLSQMLPSALKVNGFDRLPILKSELEVLRDRHDNDECLSEFYKRAKGFDEKKIWPF